MKKSVIVLAIVVLALFSLAFVLASDVDQAQAQENYIWFLPIMHKNYAPQQFGCLEPDPANCVYGPPFSP